jgi:tetratricopeptide (TPR) repeat protein
VARVEPCALCQEGDDARAAALCERALARMPRGSGPPPLLAPDVWDTSTGGIRLKLAYLRTRLGDLAGAKRSAKQAAAALEEAFPRDHPERGWGPWCLAYVLAHQGDHREEKRQWERALEFWERVFPPGHPRITLAQFPVGLYSEPAFGDVTAARAHLETAYQSAGRAHGWQHPFTGGILFGLAQVTHLGGDLATARGLWEEALAVAEKAQQYGEGTPSFRYRAWEFADFAIPTIAGMRLSVRSALDGLASPLLDLGDLAAAEGHDGPPHEADPQPGEHPHNHDPSRGGQASGRASALKLWWGPAGRSPRVLRAALSGTDPEAERSTHGRLSRRGNQRAPFGSLAQRTRCRPEPERRRGALVVGSARACVTAARPPPHLPASRAQLTRPREARTRGRRRR